MDEYFSYLNRLLDNRGQNNSQSVKSQTSQFADITKNYTIFANYKPNCNSNANPVKY